MKTYLSPDILLFHIKLHLIFFCNSILLIIHVHILETLQWQNIKRTNDSISVRFKDDNLFKDQHTGVEMYQHCTV